MKVLELCLSNGVGGLELYAAKVIRQYSRNNDIQVYPVIRKSTLLEKRLLESGNSPRYLRVLNRHFPLLAAYKLARLMEKLDIDVMHMHWARDLLLAVLAKLFCKRSIRLVYTRQMAISRDKHDRYHKFVYKYVDAFITITELLRQQAIKYLPIEPDKVRLLYYGVPSPDADSVNNCKSFFEESGLNTKSFKIGLFGRIEQGKGQHILLDAIGKLDKNGYDVQGLLIGHAMDKAYLDKLFNTAKANNITERFQYFGFHNNPGAIMGCFDVVVLSSFEETFGLVLVEAMRSGTSVIGTNAGGVPEIIEPGQTGLLFEPGDSQGLADAIAYLITNPEQHKKITESGKRQADKLFSEEQHFAELKQILAG